MQTRESGFVSTLHQVYRAYFKPSLHLEMVITHSKPVLMQEITVVCASRLQGDGYFDVLLILSRVSVATGR